MQDNYTEPEMEEIKSARHEEPLPTPPSAQKGLISQSLHEAAKRGVTQQVVTSTWNIAENRLPPQLSRTFMMAQVSLVTRWVMLAEWGSFALMWLCGLAGLWLAFNHHDDFFADFLFGLAIVCAGIWKLVQKTHKYVERQALKAFNTFAQLVQQGELPANAFPQWFKRWQHHKNKKTSLN
jgi:hypothetical protein